MTGRADWVEWLVTLKDTPYGHQGRLPGVLLDCIGPLICGAWHFGLKPRTFDITGYSRQPDGSLQPYMDEYLIRKPRDELALGDVVLNRFRLTGKPQHIAVIVGELYGEWLMLHADAVAGKVQCERIQYGRYYRYVQGYSMPGVV